jgi:hypothetical protein
MPKSTTSNPPETLRSLEHAYAQVLDSQPEEDLQDVLGEFMVPAGNSPAVVATPDRAKAKTFRPRVTGIRTMPRKLFGRAA